MKKTFWLYAFLILPFGVSVGSGMDLSSDRNISFQDRSLRIDFFIENKIKTDPAYPSIKKFLETEDPLDFQAVTRLCAGENYFS